MAKLKADLTKTPTIDTSKPGKTAGDAAKYTGAIAVAIFLFGVAAMAAQVMRNKFSQVTGVNTDGSGLSGPWEQI